MEQTTNEAAAPGWGRADLNIKFSKRRLAQLQQIAETLPASATPTDAIDHALSAAIALGSIEGRLGDLEDAIVEWTEDSHAQAARHEAQAERMEARIGELAKGIQALHALISAVAQSEDY